MIRDWPDLTVKVRASVSLIERSAIFSPVRLMESMVGGDECLKSRGRTEQARTPDRGQDGSRAWTASLERRRQVRVRSRKLKAEGQSHDQAVGRWSGRELGRLPEQRSLGVLGHIGQSSCVELTKRVKEREACVRCDALSARR